MLSLNEKDDQKRAEWVEKYVSMIDVYVHNSALDKSIDDSTAMVVYKIHYNYDNQSYHTIVCDHSSIRDAIDRAMETTK
jgi:hypothetical protein